MDKKKLSLWQWLVLLSLIVVLPVSAMMISLLRTEYGVEIATPPTIIQQNYWRQVDDNTKFSYDDLSEIVSQVNNNVRMTQEEQEREMFANIVDRISRFDSEMFRYIVRSTVGDFINYQTEMFEEVDVDTQDVIRNGIESSGDREALSFYDNVIVGDVEQYIDSDLESNTHSIGVKGYDLYAALIGVGMVGWAASTMCGDMSTIGWTVQQWYIPSWGKAAAIGIALAVMLAIIVCYWSNIVSIFQAIINAFVDAARDFAGQIIDIFNNAKGQARESFTVEVNGVEVALTTTNVSQMQKSGQYYLILKKDSNMYFYPTAVSRIVATAYLRVNRKDIGTYTKEDEDAKVLALDASKSYRVRGSELHNGSGLFFNHYHPYEFETHSWYGEPIWR